MRLLMAMLTLGAGLVLIGRPERKPRALLAAPEGETAEPESWMAGEVEAYKASH